MKKTIIIIAAVLVVLAAALTTILVVMNNRPVKADDEDCLYPYTFTYKQSDILITVNGEKPEGCAWTIEADEEGAVRAAFVSESAKKANTVFRVSPVREGSGIVTLVLTHDDILPDNRYAITIGFSVDENLNMSVISGSHLDMQGLRLLEEAGDYTLILSDSTDRTTQLAALRLGTEMTSVWSEEDCLSVSPLSFEEGKALYRLTPHREGMTRIHLFNAENGESLSMEIEVMANLKLYITGCGRGTFNQAQAEMDRNLRDMETRLGKILLPDDARITYCGRTAVVCEDGTVFDGGSVDFTSGEDSWFFSVYAGPSEADLLYRFNLTADECESVTVGSVQGFLHTDGEEQTVLWLNGEGSAYALNSVSPDRSAVLDMAARLFGMNPRVGGEIDE